MDAVHAHSSLAKIVRGVAGTIALTVFITIPAGYFAIGYHYEARALHLEANLGADRISEIIFANPELWRFEEHRLVGVLMLGLSRNRAYRALVTDVQGREVAAITADLDTPIFRRTAELTDGVDRIGEIAIDTSLRPLLVRTAIAGVIGALLAIAIYIALKMLPLRALFRVINRLDESQKLLEVEVEAKELALLKARDMGVAMRHQALHDALTNLPNRILLDDRLQQAILVGQRENKMLALIMIDLDQFKAINDTLGHHAGDLVLQQTATRLQHALRGSDTIARLGGDEFAILLTSVSDRAGVVTTAQRILEVIGQPLTIEDRTLRVAASLGIVLCPEHGDDPGQLLRRSDVAMYSAKRAKTGFAIYDVEQDLENTKQLSLQSDLRVALDEDQLVLYYQPKIDLKTDRVCGVEALVRWQHPKNGLIFPDEFIRVAEQNGLIKPLTRAVLRIALQQLVDWQQNGLALPIAINISAVNLQDPTFPHQVAEIMRDYPVAPALLEMEITETALMADPLCAIETIMKLRDIGIVVSIDDFGTGYSSMAYLKKLLVGKIKVDKSFVMEIIKNENDHAIVRAIIDLAHNLGLVVVAEGVETGEALERLKSLGCDTAQGYHMSRPVPVDKLNEWLGRSQWGLASKTSDSD